MKAIRTDKLTKKYGETLALSQLDFVVEEGEVYGFLGPNGAGKTTTIRLLLDLIRPTEGSVWLFNHELSQGISPVLGKLGAVLGDPSFYPHLSGKDNLKLIARLLPDCQSVERSLELVELQAKADLKFDEFSAGMRRRLALAAAYMKDPDLYILDEPTNGLDPEGRVRVRKTIEDLGRRGKTVFLSTHLLNEVQQICSRVGVLREGVMIAERSVDELTEGKGGVLIKVESGREEKAVQALQSIPEVTEIVSREEGLLIVTPVANSSKLVEVLVDLGIEVEEVRRHKRTLEEVFIELITAENANHDQIS